MLRIPADESEKGASVPIRMVPGRSAAIASGDGGPIVHTTSEPAITSSTDCAQATSPSEWSVMCDLVVAPACTR
ncbi:MAG: hypothetical protein QM619_00810 [Micropruina sp.]|uniref:hypothetical protein n=1 Tax=Micropruina sp. TaxID=2737536 RepID=UPI0039E38581